MLKMNGEACEGLQAGAGDIWELRQGLGYQSGRPRTFGMPDSGNALFVNRCMTGKFYCLRFNSGLMPVRKSLSSKSCNLN